MKSTENNKKGINVVFTEEGTVPHQISETSPLPSKGSFLERLRIMFEDAIFDNETNLPEGEIETTDKNVSPKIKILAEYYSPLFHKRVSKNILHWSIFLFVSISCTGMLLHYIYSFYRDLESYQKHSSSLEKYHSVYEAMEKEQRNP